MQMLAPLVKFSDGRMTVSMPQKPEPRPCATLAVEYQGDRWPVIVETIEGAPSGHRITYMGTQLDVYVVKADKGHLIAVPNYRAAIVTEHCDAYLCARLTGGNEVDAASVAAVVNWILGGAA
jgi:hypothetical protein